MKKDTPGLLILEDGSQFPGFLFGSASLGGKDQGYGEVVFNTSLTGYQEILTDPSYYGQIICMTVPHVGNTGVNSIDPESERPWCSGFIVHDYCEDPVHWRSEGKLNDYLSQHHIPGLYGLDTRALTRHLRSKGVIRGIIIPESQQPISSSLLSDLPPFEGRDLMGEVSTQTPYFWKSSSDVAKQYPVARIVAMDFGIKRNLLRLLDLQGCQIEVVPAKTSAQEILAKNPDGVFLSNGPGDPSAAPHAVTTVRNLIGQVPIFGVCMGHQILALAAGGRTFKMKFGHRGGNQPVLDLKTGKVEVSSHNHGYAVDACSLSSSVQITHLNLNDQTVEGISIPGANAFSVQYHPEACPGPHDSVQLFEQFIRNIRNNVSKIS